MGKSEPNREETFALPSAAWAGEPVRHFRLQNKQPLGVRTAAQLSALGCRQGITAQLVTESLTAKDGVKGAAARRHSQGRCV